MPKDSEFSEDKLARSARAQPPAPEDAAEDTPGERIESDTRATGGLGLATEPDRADESEEALKRAAENDKR